MGVFAEWQPRYAEQGVATFPVNDDKKPLVTRYDRLGVTASGQLAFDLRFEECMNLAFMAGRRNGISVVDVDTPDEYIWREAERIFGPTPLWVRTGRGHLQMWYRHNGEKRDTESKFLGCVDILGGGQVLGFPSRRGQGYEAIRGGLIDLDRLPVMRGLDQLIPANGKGDIIGAGARHLEMLRYLRSQAAHCDDLHQLIDVGTTFADERFDRTSDHQFTDDEIQRQAKSVWQWTQERIAAGEYFVGQGRRMILSHDRIDEVMQLGADAWFLFTHLKRCSAYRGEIIVANDLRKAMPGGEWSLPRFRKAREALEGGGVLRETRKASTWHGPAKYTWQG